MKVVLYEKKEHIALIKLNRPKQLNAINRSMADELIDVWIDFKNDSNLWAAVLCGEGRAFCAGIDIKEMNRGNWVFRESMLFGEHPIGPSNYKVWKPIIAATQGHVNGAGLWLTIECDIIISAANTLFGAGETKYNIPALLSPFICNYIPKAVASELLYTAKPINAERALQLGLINKIVDEPLLIEKAISVAEEICACGPLSIWATKEMLLKSNGLNYREILSLMEGIATPVWNSEDSIEAKKAFIEKRKPKWQIR